MSSMKRASKNKSSAQENNTVVQTQNKTITTRMKKHQVQKMLFVM